MKPQMGRPKSKNPKATQLGVRLDEEQLKRLDFIAEHYEKTRTEAIRISIDKLYSEIKKVIV